MTIFQSKLLVSQRLNLHFSMVFPIFLWFSHGFPMISYGFPYGWMSFYGLIIHLLAAIQIQPLQRRQLRQLLQRGGGQVAEGGVDLADAGAWCHDSW